jgi:hypothetical protein
MFVTIITFILEKKVNISLQRKKSQLVIPKLEEGDAPRQITKLLGPMFFFTPTTATRYKVILNFAHFLFYSNLLFGNGISLV